MLDLPGRLSVTPPPPPPGISENGPIKTQIHKLISTKFQTVMKCKLSFVMYDTFSSVGRSW